MDWRCGSSSRAPAFAQHKTWSSNPRPIKKKRKRKTYSTTKNLLDLTNTFSKVAGYENQCIKNSSFSAYQ
jgi:hypothetical protein